MQILKDAKTLLQTPHSPKFFQTHLVPLSIRLAEGYVQPVDISAYFESITSICINIVEATNFKIAATEKIEILVVTSA